MNEGLIIKALSGFYYVECHDFIYTCKAKGKLRYNELNPLVGDYVLFDDDLIIDSVKDRKNAFIRPAVANIDTFVFVASGAKPVTDPYLIDRISVIAQSAGCDFILVINKIDLSEANELKEIYINSGFSVFETDALTGNGVGELLRALTDKKSVFTGNSGVGKTSLLNYLLPGANLPTAEISEKLGRGKHTTRHVEFYSPCDNTYIADTPGFASFDVQMVKDISIEELQYDFIDFLPFIGNCRFNDCRHLSEPGCSVKENVSGSRWESYAQLYNIISNNKPWD